MMPGWTLRRKHCPKSDAHLGGGSHPFRGCMRLRPIPLDCCPKGRETEIETCISHLHPPTRHVTHVHVDDANAADRAAAVARANGEKGEGGKKEDGK